MPADAVVPPSPTWKEEDRLAGLQRYAILDTPVEQDFDDLVKLTAELLDAPIAAVNLIARGRQWFKAELGLGTREMPLDDSICAHAILQRGGMVVPDTTSDPRFDCNPLVTGGPRLRFYAGELLETPDGLPLGTLCVLDTRPRPEGLSASQRFILKTLARQVMGQIELRRALAEQRQAALQTEARLRDSQDFTRLALTSVGGVGVWTYDVANDRFTCDAAIAELYGLDVVEAANGILRERFLANVDPQDLERLRATLAEGLRRSGDLELEHRIRHPVHGTRWVLSRGHTYFDETGRATRRTGIGVELTRQREVEEQLRQSQKMEAVGQLTGGIAHDFNNLLTGITGNLELLQRRLAQDRRDVDRYVAAAQDAARRAAALTHRLLAFSRRQTLEPQPTGVDRLVGGMEDLIRRTLDPKIALELRHPPGGVWTVLADPSQLENALLNLCINARDAMPQGGRLTVRTANHPLDSLAGSALDLPEGDYVSLAVSDTGIGMTPQVIAQAFDPFFTTKSTGQGTGLGLSMVYGFACQSGGQARIVSEPGRGTTVSVYLPRHLGEAMTDTDRHPDPVSMGDGRAAVLVAAGPDRSG